MGKDPVRFLLGERLTRSATARPYNARAKQHAAAVRGERLLLPLRRRLLIYTRDPSSPRMDAAVTEALVPYEPLAPGPWGSVIRVIDVNETTGETYTPLDLDGADQPFQFGLNPSTTAPRFAQQMCYALAMTTYEQFRQALGRTPDFAFDAHDGDEDGVRLHIYPHARQEDNAYYDREAGALFFGYTFANRKAAGANQPGGLVFTALSHDVVIHEMTHALLDGMRSHLLLPTNPDVDGFHEGFADLIALFQRFRYRDLVRRAIESMNGGVTSRLLIDLARQFGETTGDGKTPLRVAFEHDGGPDDPVTSGRYKPDLEAHDMGAVLLRAAFDAFRWIYDRKTAKLRSLAPPHGIRMPAELIDLLAEDAEKLAAQFSRILIRAVDYCPPLDLRLGDFLRAIVTADFDLLPDDPWAYREAFVRAFRRYGIRVDAVADLSEDALLWSPPERDLGQVSGLVIEAVQLGADARDNDDPGIVEYRAEALGRFITAPAFPERLRCFGLMEPSSSKGIERPVVESVRVLQRVGPNGSVNFDFVAEVVQRRRLAKGKWAYGGSTIILDGNGMVRYVITKSLGRRGGAATVQD